MRHPPAATCTTQFMILCRKQLLALELSLCMPCLLLLLQAVIHHKWVSFAQRLLLVDLCFFALWLAAFTTFMILYTVSHLIQIP